MPRGTIPLVKCIASLWLCSVELIQKEEPRVSCAELSFSDFFFSCMSTCTYLHSKAKQIRGYQKASSSVPSESSRLLGSLLMFLPRNKRTLLGLLIVFYSSLVFFLRGKMPEVSLHSDPDIVPEIRGFPGFPI